MLLERFLFGRLSDGQIVSAYRLGNKAGAEVVLLDYGCTIQSLKVPDRSGSFTDVVLGYDSAREYEENDGFFGAAIGRVSNRIAKSRFCLNGREYRLPSNEGENHLHGGCGFDRRIWQAEVSRDGLRFFRNSPDGEEGYPGSLDVSVFYELNDQNELCITYSAVSDADTIVNLTNHSYFNLNGRGDILDHVLRVWANTFTEIDAQCIPTGRLLPVAGTPLDFRKSKPIGKEIDAAHGQMQLAHGYDHNYVLSDPRNMRLAAELYSPQSGIGLQVLTTKPGMQVYSGNSITPRMGKDGYVMMRRGGICLETQHFPDAINQPDFPSPIVRAGETYCEKTIFRFTTL